MHKRRKPKRSLGEESEDDVFSDCDDGGWGVIRVWGHDRGRLEVERLITEHTGIPSCMEVHLDILYVAEACGFCSIYECGRYSITLFRRVNVHLGAIRSVAADAGFVCFAGSKPCVSMWDAGLHAFEATFDVSLGRETTAGIERLTGVLRPCWLHGKHTSAHGGRAPFYVTALCGAGKGWLLGLEMSSTESQMIAQAHGGAITAAAVSQPQGAGMVVTCGMDRHICIWCASSLRALHRVHSGEALITQLVWGSSFEFVSLARDGMLQGWSVAMARDQQQLDTVS